MLEKIMKKLLGMLLITLTTYCYSMEDTYEIVSSDEQNQISILDKTYRVKNFESRLGNAPSILVLHYTGCDLVNSAHRFTDVYTGLSAHYLIPDYQDNKPLPIYNLVNEDECAIHAGVSVWRGKYMHRTYPEQDNKSIDGLSLGIEIVNYGYERTKTPQGKIPKFDMHGNLQFRPFPNEQMKRVVYIARKLKEKYQLEPWNIVGHSDVATWPDATIGPDFPSGSNIRELREFNPGAAFDWKLLAEKDIGMWPGIHGKRKDFECPQGPNIIWLKKALERVGYYVTNPTEQLDPRTLMTINAFRLHYQPDAFVYKYSEHVDWEGEKAEQTQKILYSLITEYAIPPVEHSVFDDVNKQPDNKVEQH